MRRLGGGNIAANGKRTSYWHCDTCDKKFYVVMFKRRLKGSETLEEILKLTPVISSDMVPVRRRLYEAALLDVRLDGRISDATMELAAKLRKAK
mgnify:CR=1 FL=1